MSKLSDQKFVQLAIGLVSIFIVALVSLNYLVDPYSFYSNNLLGVNKTQEIGQLRLSKAIKLREKKPAGIILGSSRAEFGFDPDHPKISKPSYNAATGGSSMYELTRYLEYAISQGEVRQVLLVADFINFNSNEEKKVSDFESYFTNKNTYSYLFSLTTLKNTYLTWVGENQKKYTIYNDNGQREKTHNSGNLQRFGGQLKKIYSQVTYFGGFNNDNHYRDTGKSSFIDFKRFLELCYENKVSLDVVFGPNHVMHWETLDYSIGLEKWYQWKRDIVNINEEMADVFKAEPFKIVDYSIYHKYTMEKLPVNKLDEMKYHWELNHYKSELGDIVLDDLAKNNTTFGVELSADNIENHLELQANLRKRNVDSVAYRQRVLIDRNKGDINDYFRFVEF